MTNPAIITPADLDGTIGFKIVGPDPEIGWGIAPAGDVNGDGQNDFVISTGGSTAYVVYGGTDFGSTFDLANLTASEGFTFVTGSAKVVTNAVGGFDINGDGLSDVVIGTYVVFGSASRTSETVSGRDLDGTNGFSLSSGHGYAPLGDFNGDGFDDLLVTFPDNSHAAVVYGGATWNRTFDISSLNGTNGFNMPSPTAGISFGNAARSAGDFNGDGLADLIIGAPESHAGHGYATGVAYVVFGQEHESANFDVQTLDGSNGFMIVGAEAAGRFGWSIGRAGDVNGDGYDDLIVQATDADPRGHREGSTYLLFGGPGGFPAVFDLENIDGVNGVRIDGISYRGQAMDAATGDFNGDGIADIAIGAPDRTQLGLETGPENVYVIYGRTDGWQRTIDVSELDGSNGFTVAAGPGTDDFGRFVELTDVNGDGFDDLLVSAPQQDHNAGSVYVVYGHASGPVSPFVSSTPHVTGTDGADVLRGTAGSETLDGLGGDDYFRYSGGGDQYRGDAGFDTVSYANADRAVSLRLQPDGPANSGAAAGDTYLSIERVIGTRFSDQIVGDTGDDRIDGGDGNDTLHGNSGNDRLYGNSGNDVLYGDEGADRMVGGQGNDIYFVDDSHDRVIERAGEGTDTVNSSIELTLSANVEKLVLTGNADLRGTGNDLDNVLTGNSGVNVLFGMGGNDTLDGKGGIDRMAGGTGDDTYYVDQYGDHVIENASEGTDSVFASADYKLGANIEKITLAGTADIWAYGNDGDNVLTGNDGGNKLYGMGGSDTLSGGNGNDWLEGGVGQDKLIGGSGADGFVFRDGDFGGATPATADRILDFTQGEDKIRLNYVDSDTTHLGDQAFHFIGTSAFDGNAGELRYEEISGDTYISGDTNGDGHADFMIRVDGLHAMIVSDFVL